MAYFKRGTWTLTDPGTTDPKKNRTHGPRKTRPLREKIEKPDPFKIKLKKPDPSKIKSEKPDLYEK